MPQSIIQTSFATLVGCVVVGGWFAADFNTFQVQYAPVSHEHQRTELVIVRRWDPRTPEHKFRIKIGLFRDELPDVKTDNTFNRKMLVGFGLAPDDKILASMIGKPFQSRILDHAAGDSGSMPVEFDSVADVVAWGRMFPEQLDVIIAGLTDERSETRKIAAEALGWLGNADPKVLAGLEAIAKPGVALLRGIKDETILRGLGMYIDSHESERTDAFVVLAACTSLGRLGHPQSLVDLLEVRHSMIRDKAATSLMQLDRSDPFIIDALMKWITRSPRPRNGYVLADGFFALAMLGSNDPRVGPFFLDILKYGEERLLRGTPCIVLPRLAETDPILREQLLALVIDDNPEVSSLAAGVLARVANPEPEVRTTLLALLNEQEVVHRRMALHSLGYLPDSDGQFAEIFRNLLHDESPEIRIRSALMLIRRGFRDPECMNILSDVPLFLEYAEFRDVKAVAEKIVQESNGDRDVVKVFLPWLVQGPKTMDVRLGGEGIFSSGGERIPVFGAHLMRQLECRDPDVIEGLAALLDNVYPDIKCAAAGALLHLAPEDPRALASLDTNRDGLAEGAELNDLWGDSLLATTMNPRVRELLAQTLQAPAERIDASAIKAALKFAVEPVRINDVLAERSVSSRAEIRAGAVDLYLLRGQADEPATTSLEQMLNDGEPIVRNKARKVLGELGQKRNDWTDENLLHDLEDSDSSVRTRAGLVLAYRFHDGETLSAASRDQIEALRSDSRAWVRRAAIQAVWFIERRAYELASAAAQDEFDANYSALIKPAGGNE
ncbi:MAG TPA: hypothetical protein PLR25_14020 [Planctomycetaceae bacterium]|nr:hypothetical protein [Planctomycetaceae bacterium]